MQNTIVFLSAQLESAEKLPRCLRERCYI